MRKNICSIALMLLCFFCFSFTHSEPAEKSFAQKKAAFEAALSNDCITLETTNNLQSYLLLLEGSSIEQLSTLFEVERDAYGCWWVTVSTSCSACYGDSSCASYRRKSCRSRQLEYCGSYWSGKSRYRSYTRCC